jgi:uncharacterized protein (TIGR01777 family)
MAKNILITGGTGLVGRRLTELLRNSNYTIAHLSRNPEKNSSIRSYRWDYSRNEIDQEAIKFADVIIHLAGENISRKKWTNDQKKKIVDSRVKTSELLFDEVKRQNKTLDAFISASAIGFYGTYTSETVFDENFPAGNDFLAETVKRWEDSVSRFEDLNIRTVKLRTGIVLSKKGGALPKMANTIKTGFGSSIGSGKQYMPWIHIEDLIGMFRFMFENETLSGVYNATAPEHITNKEFMRTLAKTMSKPFFMPNVPGIFMKLLFGEMSSILLEGSRVSSEKIMNAGYKFKYPDLKGALECEL